MGNTDSSRGICRSVIAYTLIALSFALTFATGCSNQSLPNAFVTIVPGNTMVGTGATFVMYAGASPTGVTWSITGSTGCNTACGTLTGATGTSVNYVAPVSIPGSTMTVTITATSMTNSSIKASETLTVFPVYVVINGPSSPTVIPLTSAQFTASVVNDPSKEGVTWSVSGTACSGTALGCGTFTSSTPTQTTFNAPAADSLQTINVTATSVADPAESATFAVTVPKLAIFVFSPRILPPAFAGKPYTATINVVGNTPPYTFTPANLPPWLTYSPATPATGTSITLTGTPPAGTQGTYYTQMNVADSTAPVPLSGSQSFAITTYSSPPTGNGLLAGSYAFFGTGWVDGTSVQTTYNGIEYIGSFTADGNGNITGGELDVNSPTTGLTSYTSLGGTYNVQYGLDQNSNPVPGYQTGVITLVPAGKPPLPITFAVSLSSVQNGVATLGHFVEFDDSTGIGANVTANSSGIRAQGSLALQSTSALNTTTSPISGPYAFGMAGYSSVAAVSGPCYAVHTCGPISLAGSINFGAGGSVSSGIEDLTVAENNGSAIALTGAIGNSGNTDASGRVTASIVAAATANMPSWPSNFVIYAISPQTFYMMSADPYTTNSLIGGTVMQQNLADIASTPFSSTEPIVLYGNVTSTTTFSTKGPNGQIRVELQLLTVVPTSPTAGTMSGFQWVNASGTYTANGGNPGVIGSFSYTVSPTTGRVTSSTTGEPYLYLVDTSQGFGTQYSSANNTPAGLFQFQPQTATTLNAGYYSYYVFNGTSQIAPMETGILTIPSGGVPATGSAVAVTGQDYTAFGAVGNVYVAGENILFNGPITGTIKETSGMFSQNSIIFPGTMQGCGQQAPQGAGWVISPTSFICTPGGGSFAGIHLFQQ
jgi:hypothetical protein